MFSSPKLLSVFVQTHGRAPSHRHVASYNTSVWCAARLVAWKMSGRRAESTISCLKFWLREEDGSKEKFNGRWGCSGELRFCSFNQNYSSPGAESSSAILLCFRGEAAASNPPSLRDGERGAGPERAQRFAGGGLPFWSARVKWGQSSETVGPCWLQRLGALLQLPESQQQLFIKSPCCA